MKLPGNRIVLESTINTRDIGGYQTADGKTIKYGKLIRTDQLDRLTANDIRYFQGVLKARYDVDLRGFDEIERTPDKEIPGCQFLHIPVQENLKGFVKPYPHEDLHIEREDLHGMVEYFFAIDPNGDILVTFEQMYRHFLTPFGAKGYSRFLHLCKNTKEGSILVHCKDGKDRTGIAVAILMLALGVDEETVIKDYLKTNENTYQKWLEREDYLVNHVKLNNSYVFESIKAMTGVKRNWIEAAIDEMKKQGGSITGFLNNQLSFSDEDIQELRKNYLE